jgi:hypothetical protein
MAERRRSKRGGTSRAHHDEQRDPVPEPVVERAKSAFQHRAEGDLAPLVFDSLLDATGTEDEHRMRFEHPSGNIEVQVSMTGEACTVRGRSGLAPARIELELEGSDVALVSETATGEFTFDSVPRGTKRIIVAGASAPTAVYTDWFWA